MKKHFSSTFYISSETLAMVESVLIFWENQVTFEL